MRYQAVVVVTSFPCNPKVSRTNLWETCVTSLPYWWRPTCWDPSYHSHTLPISDSSIIIFHTIRMSHLGADIPLAKLLLELVAAQVALLFLLLFAVCQTSHPYVGHCLTVHLQAGAVAAEVRCPAQVLDLSWPRHQLSLHRPEEQIVILSKTVNHEYHEIFVLGY